MKVIIISQKAAPVLFPGIECVVTGDPEEAGQHEDADLVVDLDFTAEEKRVSALSRLMPSLVMVNAVETTIAEIGRPFVRINGWPGLCDRTIHELAVTDRDVAVRLRSLYERLGCSFRFAPDIPGMITARVLAAIINEAWFTWQDGVSSKEDIDTAMRLGTNYPMGPFEWGERIGLTRILRLLDKMATRDSRHMAAESLKMACGEIKI
jgi:3-hydroxybutyryl-CoA dehydrogenase